MINFLRITMILTLFFSGACASPPPPAAQPSPVVSKPEEQKLAIDETRPIVQIFRQAEKVHSRFRYLAEEFKTTYKPEKQKALLANVRETVQPACQEMKRIIESSKTVEHEEIAKEMVNTCESIDSALERRDMELLRPALRKFNPVFERLQNVIAEKKER